MRPPRTIWLYTLGDLWRIVLLTTAVLVTVLAFAATVRVLAEGKAGPLDSLRFMLLAIPPMLQYALPFAAGFGATLAYHRMAQDNEITAARAGGLSHALLVAPAAATGLILAVLLWVLSAQAIPRFLRSMEEIVAQDFARLMVNRIQRGEAVEVDQAVVFADSVRRVEPEAASRAYDRLLLSRVAMIFADESGDVTAEATANHAWIHLERVRSEDAHEGDRAAYTQVTLTASNAQVVSEGQVSAEYGRVQGRKTVRAGFNDDPKFLTSRELRELPHHPDRLNVIDFHRRELAYHFAESDAVRAIDSSLRTHGRAVLRGHDGRYYTLRAAGLEPAVEASAWSVLPPAGRAFEVERRQAAPDGGPDPAEATLFATARATLKRDPTRVPSALDLSFALELGESSVWAIHGDQPPRADAPLTQHEKPKFNSLTPLDNPLPNMLKRSSRELLADLGDRAAGDDLPPGLADEAARHAARLQELEREIVSKQHERLAMSGACLVMVLAGGVTAMRLGGSLPLTVYLWSFFPALAAVLTVTTGQRFTHQAGSEGLLVLWGGVGLLAAYTIVAFAFVARR